MLVCLGTAVVVLACAGMGMQYDAQSRVIQGIVTGIGFIGAGSILKLDKEREIQGLTTAAGTLDDCRDRHRLRRRHDWDRHHHFRLDGHRAGACGSD